MIGAGTFASNTGVVTLNGAPTFAEDLDQRWRSGSTGTVTISTAFAQSGAVTPRAPVQ